MLVRRFFRRAGQSVPAVVLGSLLGFLFATTALGKDEAVAAPAAKSPLVVFVHSRTCKVCARVRPLIDEIEGCYKGKVSFVRLDVTDEAAKKQSEQIAKDLGVKSFLTIYEDTYPCVGVFNARKRCVTEMYGLKSKEEYVRGIEKGLVAD